jgi:short-subunit dehydrogenase
MIPCDVTSDESVAVAVARAHAELGQIDLLVNNAGVGVTGAAEESSIAQVRSLFETNFHGVVRVTNAVLPIMRAQGSGRILNVGSGLGLIPAPYSAYYSASKHAIEGYSESLDHEVEFGVRVVVIEPAATRTSFETSTAPSDTPLAAYDASRAKYLVAYERAMAVADTAESVAETIVRAAREKLRACATRLVRPRGRSHSPGVLPLGLYSTRFCGRNSGWRNQQVYLAQRVRTFHRTLPSQDFSQAGRGVNQPLLSTLGRGCLHRCTHSLDKCQGPVLPTATWPRASR